MIKISVLYLLLFTTLSYADPLNVDDLIAEAMRDSLLEYQRKIEAANKHPNFKIMESKNFEDTGNESSSVSFKKNSRSNKWDLVYTVKIAFNVEGKKRIYILSPKKCSYKNAKVLGITTTTVNDKNVRLRSYCEGKKMYYTLYSGAGINYVINEFKRKQYVFIKFAGGVLIRFDAHGFIKAWNGLGDDAL